MVSSVEKFSAETAHDELANNDIDERKLLLKIDLHVLPYICVMYTLAFLDRVNISNAVLFGLKDDLKLVGNQYSTALVIFFVPYILCEIPSNILLKKLKPHIWLSICMTLFGLVTMLQGFVQNFGGLMATRWFLGVFEAGMFPGCFYLLAMWYRREESQKRYTFFFCSTTLAGAFGGLLASAIGKMDGVRGYGGWRWVFILEGLATALFGIAWFFLLPDFPEEAEFLSKEEREFVKKRLAADVGASAHQEKATWRDNLAVLTDYKIIIGGFAYFGLIVPAYGYAYFAPTIINQLGYGTIQSQLHSVPPWAAAFGFAMALAFISDRLRHRWFFTFISAAVCLIGFAILLSDPTRHSIKYGALFLAASGAYTSMPIIIGWFNTNLAGHTRRAVGSAWQVSFGNIGGIIASFSFPTGDGPKYTKGYAICLAFVCLSMVSSAAYFVAIMVENRRRARSMPPEVTEKERERLGDLNYDYRYMY
ncbi:MFS general substrate transporter [Guyanagaster necrorhizus]|uniref:MFS general substrate transporter n=1 Tax=Guyanagaster necrorhizus TaxID=856835 RepID=A0A9P8APE1_9AGAR|nr:MFS general substrate transporter [Guyanagaster necrorhizus MCA 3950]KAG7442850.1 MFS general substrate transporter [Guyanagaster necrorhizus MCA 3950]